MDGNRVDDITEPLVQKEEQKLNAKQVNYAI